MKQGSLFPFSQPIEPDRDRAKPAIWIRRLMIVESLEPDAQVIREVSFRQGLNIIQTAERTLDEDRPVGHSVGKTLLLRLIRYCLGESSYSVRTVRRAISNSLPNAFVLAQISLGGDWWTVARPIGMGHSTADSRAVKSGECASIRRDSFDKAKYADYLSAIEAISRPWFAQVHLPSANHAPRWIDLLAWIARDQECRLRHSHEWRDPESESGTAPMAREDASLLIRMVMGLLNDDERALRIRHASLLADHARLNRLIQTMKNRIEAVEAGLREELSLSDDSPGGKLLSPFAASQAELKLEGQRRLLKDIQSQLSLDRFDALARESAIAAGILDRQLSSIQGELAASIAEIKQLEAADTNAFYASFAQQERWCHLFERKDDAVKRGCPGQSPVTRPGARDPRHQLRIDEAKEYVAQLRVQEANFTQKLASSHQKHLDLDAQRQVAKKKLDTRVAGVREQMGRLSLSLDHAKRLGQLWDELGLLESKLEARTKAIDASNRSQEKARAQLAQSLGILSRHFDATLAELLGTDAGGKIRIDGRSITPVPNASVAVSGAALRTTSTVVGFDVACLIASVCGLGSHPRLILHDSPREADMEEFMYHRLFNFIASVEGAFGDRPPSFQYIITTTTPPPKALQDGRFVRLTLDARSADGLLLRRRLSV